MRQKPNQAIDYGMKTPSTVSLLRIMLFLWGGLAGVSPLWAQLPSEEATHNQMIAQAYYENLQVYVKQNTRRAIRLLEEVFLFDTTHVPSLYLYALLQYEKGITEAEIIENMKNAEACFLLAEEYFQRAARLAPSYDNYKAFYHLGKFYYDFGEYNKAQNNLEIFLNSNQWECSIVDHANQMMSKIQEYFFLLSNPVPFSPKQVQGVCTKDDEYLPFLTHDGERLYYTHRFYKKSRFANQPVRMEELCYADRINQKDNTLDKFTAGIPMEPPFNQEDVDQGGISLTIDNRQMFITLCKFERTFYTSYKNCDIYTSEFIDGKWTPLVELGPEINGGATWEGQPSITSDGRILYFASAREGGLGGIDIYYSVRNGDKWSKAMNLGPTINTSGDDKTPFIHSDTQTLYFASNSRVGVGEFDIYHSSYLGNGQWTEPKNIGYPINTEENDLAYIVTTNGRKIFFASDQIDTKGGFDIFSAPLHKDARPKKVLFIKGALYDEAGGALTNAAVELQNIKTFELTKGLVDPQTGNYAVATAYEDGEEYILTVKKQGYYFESELIRPSKKDIENPPQLINIKARPIEIGSRIRLENIYFAFNSAEIDSTSTIALTNFADFLDLNPSLKVSIYGHTDNIGDDEFNLRLSERRAKAVSDYLIMKGIANERLTWKGYGETRPLASNSTKSGRAANRRTEFEVIVK